MRACSLVGQARRGPEAQCHSAAAHAGETLRECAVRETLEETGLRLRDDYGAPALDAGLRACCGVWSEPLCAGASDRLFFSPTLAFPTPFAAADVITRGEDGRVAYHYSILEARLAGRRAAAAGDAT